MSDKFTLLRFAAPASVTLLACQQIGSFMGQVSKCALRVSARDRARVVAA